MSVRIPKTNSEPPWLRAILLFLGLGFLFFFLFLPLAAVFAEALRSGWKAYADALMDREAFHAIKLTVVIAMAVLPVNIAIGIAASWAISKFEFRGKGLLVTLIDLPFAISPVVVGLVFLLIFGMQGLLGPWLDTRGIKIVFALPGMILVTLFITFPFIARELIPLMQAQGGDDEEAAISLGASGVQMFFRVTLPNIRWGLLYGVILANARAMGEFGAVSVVSGHIRGETNTLPLHVEILYNEYNAVAAFASASILALLALATLAAKMFVEWRMRRENEMLGAELSPEGEILSPNRL
ncbi:MAG: sulfate ABC transporter permease subunit CysW [Candidatus Accumulibacter sp.]|jgi:sulfate transport system permease protein|nr:sulfate ABC transporter permease subunit CysW [Accumulibacter sp.]